jgi:hypothetical protein
MQIPSNEAFSLQPVWSRVYETRVRRNEKKRNLIRDAERFEQIPVYAKEKSQGDQSQLVQCRYAYHRVLGVKSTLSTASLASS